MNGFEKHGIKYLSPSQINTWIAQPAFWVATKLLGHRSVVGAAAHCGTAVEAGVSIGLFDPSASLEACVSEAQATYDKLMVFKPDPDKQKRRDMIEPMVGNALKGLRSLGRPQEPAEGKHQHKIEIEIEGVGVPFLGYLDFLYPDDGIIVDLKTTTRMPSTLSEPHARQGAVYNEAHGNYAMKFAYATPSKFSIIPLEDGRTYINQVRDAAQRLERFLSLRDDAQSLADLVSPPDTQSFYWRGNEDMRREAFGV